MRTTNGSIRMGKSLTVHGKKGGVPAEPQIPPVPEPQNAEMVCGRWWSKKSQQRDGRTARPLGVHTQVVVQPPHLRCGQGIAPTVCPGVGWFRVRSDINGFNTVLGFLVGEVGWRGGGRF